MEFLPLGADDLDQRPPKRQRTESPAHLNSHSLTKALHTMEDDSSVTREPSYVQDQDPAADDLPSIPGLGLVGPEVSNTEVPAVAAEVLPTPGLLDALIQHVDSQSNVQNTEAQLSAQRTRAIVGPEKPNLATPTAPLAGEEDLSDQEVRTLGTDGIDSCIHVGEAEQKWNSAPLLGAVGADRSKEARTAAENQQVGTTLAQQVDSTSKIPFASAEPAVADDGSVSETTAQRDAQTSTKPPSLQQRNPDNVPVTTATLYDLLEYSLTAEELGASVKSSPGQEDSTKNQTINNPEIGQDAISTEHRSMVSSIGDEAMQVDKKILNHAGEELDMHQYHTYDLDGPLQAAVDEQNASEESCACQSKPIAVGIENEAAQLEETDAVQPTVTEKLELEPGPQREKSPLSILEETNPNMNSLRHQLSSVGAAEELEGARNGRNTEWEMDSSPLDSSSDSTSTDDSDERDVAVDGDYAMLDPEEQARILMKGDIGSDDEGHGRSGGKGEAAQPRTANEKLEEVVQKPDIRVTEDMKIEELGSVETIVENIVLVKAKVSGEYRVLASNSLLCLQDRSVVGVVSETLGRVQQPLYTIRFTNDEAIREAGLGEKSTPVYYVEQHSTFVFTQSLKAVKGSDASNIHDEEVGADEVEFSDDEAEAEHKRQLKLKKRGCKEDRNDRFGHSRGKRSSFTNGSARMDRSTNLDTTVEMNYDDIPPMGDDGYTPLARPTNLHEMMGPGEGPLEVRQPVPSFSDRGHHDRGRGRTRGRGGRGNRGERGGRGRGGWDRSSHHHHQPADRRGASALPKPEPVSSPAASTFGLPQPQSQTSTFALPPIPPASQYPYPQPTPPQRQQQQQQQQQHPSFSFSYSNPTPPQAPSLTPQPSSSSHPTFSPSPISPLPQGHFNFANYANQQNPQHSPIMPSYNRYEPQSQQQQQQHQPYQSHLPTHQWQNQFPGGRQTQQMPPPGSHINPAFFEALRQQRETGSGGAGGATR